MAKKLLAPLLLMLVMLAWSQDSPMQRVPVTMLKAIGKANSTMSATFFHAALEKDGARFQWSFGLKGPQDKPYEISVDAGTGEILTVSLVERSQKYEKDPPITVTLPIESAIAAALTRQPGFVLEADVDAEARNPNWTIKVLADDGASHEVVVSGERPQVLMFDGVAALGRRDRTGHKIPLDQAVATARTVAKGSFFGATLDQDKEQFIWNLSMMSAKGVPYEISIDAEDGSLIQANQVQYSQELKKNPPRLVPIDMATASDIAARSVPGMTIEASTDLDEGKPVWYVTVLALKDGSKHEVEVGGARPHVLSMDNNDSGSGNDSADTTNGGGSKGNVGGAGKARVRRRRRRGGG